MYIFCQNIGHSHSDNSEFSRSLFFFILPTRKMTKKAHFLMLLYHLLKEFKNLTFKKSCDEKKLPKSNKCFPLSMPPKICKYYHSSEIRGLCLMK